MDAVPLFELSSNDVLKGKFHNTYATVLKNLGTSKNREDYIDRALVEFAAASYHFEQGGDSRFRARRRKQRRFSFCEYRKIR